MAPEKGNIESSKIENKLETKSKGKIAEEAVSKWTPEVKKYMEKGDKMQRETLDKLARSNIVMDLVDLLKQQGNEKSRKKIADGLKAGFDNMDSLMEDGTKVDRNNPAAQFVLLAEITLLDSPLSAAMEMKFNKGEVNRYDLTKMVFQRVMDRRLAASTGADKTKWKNTKSALNAIFIGIEMDNQAN